MNAPPHDVPDAVNALAASDASARRASPSADGVVVALATPRVWPPFLPFDIGATLLAHALGANVTIASGGTGSRRAHDRAILDAMRLPVVGDRGLKFESLPARDALRDQMIALVEACAGFARAFVGVPDPDLCEPMARALHRAGVTRALVACGADGLPGITLDGPTEIATMRGGVVTREKLDVFEEYEIEFCAPGMLRLPAPADASGNANPFGDPLEAASILGAVLQGAPGWPAQAIMLNAAAILELADLTPGLGPGFREAGFALRDGRAYATWQALRT